MTSLPPFAETTSRRSAPRTQVTVQAEQDLRDQGKLLKQWRQWRRDKLQALLDGPHDREVRELVGFLNRMRLSSAPALIEQIEQADWIHRLSDGDKHDLLGVISTRITGLRLRNGLPPFDDGLPGDPPKAFEQIKELMGVR